MGVRDYNRHKEVHESIIIDENYAVCKTISIKKNKTSFLDIDVDVMNPEIFPWCGSIINGGINKEELERIILKVIKKDCNILAISEYIPNWDFQFEGATMIMSLIKLFLLRK